MGDGAEGDVEGAKGRVERIRGGHGRSRPAKVKV
jgi:hypothetical protein